MRGQPLNKITPIRLVIKTFRRLRSMLTGNKPAGTAVYVMNSNYIDEIKAMTGELFMFIPIDQGN